MRRFERHDAGLPDRPGINPFTKQPIVIKGRPPRTVRCEVAVDGAELLTSWTWFEAGARTAGPHADRRVLHDAERAELYGAELVEDLLAEGFREDGSGSAAPPAIEGGARPDRSQDEEGDRDIVAAITKRCRDRGWFGSDMHHRFAKGESIELRRFRNAPATVAEILETERQLGFALPPLLRDLYTGVANGGFGPGYGFVGAVGGASADFAENIAAGYRHDRDLSPWLEESGCDRGDDGWFEPFYDEWPGHVLRLVHWGCAIWSCLDVRRGRVLRFEHLQGKRTREAMMVEASSLRSWLEQWLQGKDVFKS